MKKIITLAWLAFVAPMLPLSAQSSDESRKPADPRFFEMRIYHCHPGKLEALHERFRNHTLRLFEKHGMTNIGYWTPIDSDQGAGNVLGFLLAYPSREARERSWKAFVADPEWKAAYAESHQDGPLVARVESTFLKATDYSPVVAPSGEGPERLFEFRRYTATRGNLEKLHNRFRDHTISLFSKHGMTHVGYWVPVEADQGADDTLVFLLAHPSREAREESFNTFREDPAWIAAKDASEKGGSLTAHVESVLLKPTDYSAIK